MILQALSLDRYGLILGQGGKNMKRPRWLRLVQARAERKASVFHVVRLHEVESFSSSKLSAEVLGYQSGSHTLIFGSPRLFQA